MPTVEMLFREVVYHKSDDQILIFHYGGRETLFRVLVRVQAGFDLSDNFSVVLSEGKVVVTLPPPVILFSDADDESLYEYFSEGQNIGYLRLQAILTERAKAVEEDALRLGILGEASANARTRLGETLKALGVEEYEILIQTENLPPGMEVPLENP